MITVISSDERERQALTSLLEARGWPTQGFGSLRRWQSRLAVLPLRVVVSRHRLSDGYSDDVIKAVRDRSTTARILVITNAVLAGEEEARLITLGADCVLREPIRHEVLCAYISKYRGEDRAATPTPATAVTAVPFADGQFNITERTLRRDSQTVRLTPREAALVQALVQGHGRVVSYEQLYDLILDRRYNGETSNMRVLLGKLQTSAAEVGISLRDCIEVIAKTGYRYRGGLPGASRAAKPSRRRGAAAR